MTDSQPRDDRHKTDKQNRPEKLKIYDFPCTCPKILVPLHANLRARCKINYYDRIQPHRV